MNESKSIKQLKRERQKARYEKDCKNSDIPWNRWYCRTIGARPVMLQHTDLRIKLETSYQVPFPQL